MTSSLHIPYSKNQSAMRRFYDVLDEERIRRRVVEQSMCVTEPHFIMLFIYYYYSSAESAAAESAAAVWGVVLCGSTDIIQRPFILIRTYIVVANPNTASQRKTCILICGAAFAPMNDKLGRRLDAHRSLMAWHKIGLDNTADV